MTEPRIIGRILNHLLNVTTQALDVGALTPPLWGFEERERLMVFYECVCGARLHAAYYRGGGVHQDLPDGLADDIFEWTETFPKVMDALHDLITDNRIFKQRNVDIGVVDQEQAISWGMTGVMLRSTGLAWDLRKAQPYECYNDLDFDIPNRRLTVYHNGQIEPIEKLIHELNLGSKKLLAEQNVETDFKENKIQKKLLWAVLTINFAFFLIEMMTGLISKSMGLVADSLDMLADSFVYGISLYAVGGTVIRKKRIATLAGYFQMTLAIIGFIEVLRRFLGVEAVPDFSTMIIVSIFALIANGICLYLLQKSKSKEAHMQASMIFTSNDVIINFGVKHLPAFFLF